MSQRLRLAAPVSAALLLAVAGSLGAASKAPERIETPGLHAAGEVIRDIDGLPHIYAADEHDLAFLVGWIQAEDRLFQLDTLRRQASGTLAELLGPGALRSDVELRILGLRRAAERSWEIQSPELRMALEAYAAGVNAWVAAHPLPIEYAALELTSFDPWTPIDSLVIAKVMAFQLSFDLDIDPTINYLTYVGVGQVAGFDGDALFFEDLFRSAPFDPTATVPDATGDAGSLPAMQRKATAAAARSARGQASGPKAETVLALARSYRRRAEQIPILREALERSERVKGSNEWAVSGRLTRSGRPIIANDPHLSLSSPAIFYQNHLVARQGGFDVIGSSIPGIPYVLLGQNRHVTWGLTTVGFDVTDTYLEAVVQDPTSPSGLSTVYLGSLEHVLPVPLAFRYNQPANGQPDDLLTASPGSSVGGVAIPPVALIVPRRNNGPILSLMGDSALSVQFTGFGGTREIESVRRMNLARDLDDFRAALQFFDFGAQNFVYADIDGNIAYFTSSEVPLREDLQSFTVAGSPPWFIRNGTGGNEWLPVVDPQPAQATPYAVLPFEELPQTVNPANGWFVNANNDPAGVTLDNQPLNQLRPSGLGLYYLGYTFDFGTRSGRITEALQERLAAGRVGAADMQAIQADTVMRDAQVFTPYILQAFDHAAGPDAHPLLQGLAADPRVVEAAGRLRAWNHTTPTGVLEGYDASDRDGNRAQPSLEEIESSIAATIYSVWRWQILKNTIDATIDGVNAELAQAGVQERLAKPGSQEAIKALRALLDNYATRGGAGASGIVFFNVPGVADAEARRDILMLASLSAALDELAGPAFQAAFHGSTNQIDYRWGRLHRLIMNSPLGAPFSVPPAGGAFPPSFADLPGIATDGGFGVTDASSHSARANHSEAFRFGSGPVRRYVGEPGRTPGSIRGETALPGGASGVLGSPHYVDLLGRWLTNDTYPLRTGGSEVIRDLEFRWLFVPARR